MDLPPVDERSQRLLLAVIRRSGQRSDDLLQEAWLAYLAGSDPLRHVWRIDRSDRRLQAKERLRGDMDLPEARVKERW